MKHLGHNRPSINELLSSPPSPLLPIKIFSYQNGQLTKTNPLSLACFPIMSTLSQRCLAHCRSLASRDQAESSVPSGPNTVPGTVHLPSSGEVEECIPSKKKKHRRGGWLYSFGNGASTGVVTYLHMVN